MLPNQVETGLGTFPLFLALPFNILPVSPLVRLNVLEAPFGISYSVQLRPFRAPMSGSLRHSSPLLLCG